MKIVLVNPRRVDVPWHPLGLLYIAAYLEKKGFEVKVIDLNFDARAENVVNDILKENPDIVGMGAATLQIDFALAIAKELKLRVPDVPVFIGGIHTTVMPKEVLKNDSIDYIVIGEGEITTAELCKVVRDNKDLSKVDGLGYKDKGNLIFNKPRELIEDLDSLPFPARHLLPSKWYFSPPIIRDVWAKAASVVMGSRGCPYRCIYCSSKLMFGRKVRYRSPKNIIEELKYLRDNFGVKAVWFADDTFTVNKEWVKEFCQELKKKKWNDFKWVCQSRVNTFSYELGKIMKEAGCIKVDFGVESGSEKVLKIIKKDITKEQVIKSFDAAKRLKLLRGATFMVGIPGETEEDLLETEKLALRIKPTYTDFGFATPYPGTELYEIAKKHGFINENIPYHKWIMSKQTDKPIMYADLTEEQLVKWRSRLHNHFFLRNYMSLLKNPNFYISAVRIMFKGRAGFISGLKRFIKTGKIDSIPVQVVREYRRKTK